MKTRFVIILLLGLNAFCGCTKGDEPEKNITIVNISPQKSKANSQIDVIGTGFLQMNTQDSSKQIKVFIGNTQVHASIVNDTLITVFIPANATTGNFCIEWNGKRTCSQQTFTILPGNTERNTFMQMPDFPGNFQTGFMFAIDNNVYIHDMNDLWCFNIESFQWARVAKPPERATSTATFVINGKAYVFGGLTFSNSNGDNQLWEYNPQTNQWNVKTSMPGTKRYWPTAFVHNNKAYIAGGTVNGYGSSVPSELWMYDPAMDKWTRQPDLMEAVASQSSVYRIGNKFYLQAYNGTIEYNPATGEQRMIQGFVPTKLSAVHSSNRWQFAYVVNAGGASNDVQRIALNINQSLVQTVKYPIDPVFYPNDLGSKYIQSYASVGEELFFIINEYRTRKTEFWEYLPE